MPSQKRDPSLCHTATSMDGVLVYSPRKDHVPQKGSTVQNKATIMDQRIEEEE